MKKIDWWKAAGYLHIGGAVAIVLSTVIKNSGMGVLVFSLISAILQAWLGKLILNKNITAFWIAWLLAIPGLFFSILSLSRAEFYLSQGALYLISSGTSILTSISVLILWYKLRKEENLKMPRFVKTILILLIFLIIVAPFIIGLWWQAFQAVSDPNFVPPAYTSKNK